MVTVRTTMEPWKELEVDARTFYSLKNQGLLVEEDARDTDVAQDPSAARGVDAEKAHEESLAQRREELGEPRESRSRGSKSAAKDNG